MSEAFTSERLSSADVACLYRETAATPQHLGWLATFDVPAGGFDYDRLTRLLSERISLAPRYRQRLRTVPGSIANPVWVDDQRFDLTYHVRRSALPQPGSTAQLLEFAARVQSRRLDRSRPLWELYLVEGLADGRVAVISKVHQAMAEAADIGEVLLDAAATPRRAVRAEWLPAPEPSGAELLLAAVRDVAGRPGAVVQRVVLGVRELRAPGLLSGLLGGAAEAAGALLHRPADSSPLRAGPGPHRRLALARTRLDDHRRVREAFGGTVNDAALATIAGALRSWLIARGEPPTAAQLVRALVPLSVSVLAPAGTPEAQHPAGGGRRITPVLVDLPVGEPDAARRLAQVRYAMAAHTASGLSVGQAVGADVLASLGGFAPPVLHALGARASSGLARRLYSLVVTNVPGPQLPLYAAGARMRETFPLPPLGRGRALSIAMTSYDGGLYYGITADRDVVPDVALLAESVERSLAELVAASRSGQPGRRRTHGR